MNFETLSEIQISTGILNVEISSSNETSSDLNRQCGVANYSKLRGGEAT
jgi:hypothetical protein